MPQKRQHKTATTARDLIPVEYDDPRPKRDCPRCDGSGSLLGYEFTVDEGRPPECDLSYRCPVCRGEGYVLEEPSNDG